MNNISLKYTMRNAFTLIELLIVITIIGIASALIVPYVGSRSDLQVAAVARSFIADVQYTQNLAITTRQRHGLLFAADQYTVERFSGTTAITIKHPIEKDNFVVRLGSSGKDVRRGVAMPLVNVRQGAVRLVFDSMGTPMAFSGTTFISTDAPVRVTLSAGTATIVVRIEPFTGEVTVE